MNDAVFGTSRDVAPWRGYCYRQPTNSSPAIRTPAGARLPLPLLPDAGRNHLQESHLIIYGHITGGKRTKEEFDKRYEIKNGNSYRIMRIVLFLGKTSIP